MFLTTLALVLSTLARSIADHLQTSFGKPLSGYLPLHVARCDADDLIHKCLALFPKIFGGHFGAFGCIKGPAPWAIFLFAHVSYAYTPIEWRHHFISEIVPTWELWDGKRTILCDHAASVTESNETLSDTGSKCSRLVIPSHIHQFAASNQLLPPMVILQNEQLAWERIIQTEIKPFRSLPIALPQDYRPRG